MGRQKIKKVSPKSDKTHDSDALHRNGKYLALALAMLSVVLGVGISFLFWPERQSAEALSLGKATYTEHCASCHGARLEGAPNWKTPLPDGSYPAPPHDASGHTWHHDDEYLFLVTRDGGRSRGPGSPSAMPGFGQTLEDSEIRSILAFIKTTWPPKVRAAQAERNR